MRYDKSDIIEEGFCMRMRNGWGFIISCIEQQVVLNIPRVVVLVELDMCRV